MGLRDDGWEPVMNINILAGLILIGCYSITSTYADDIRRITVDWSGETYANSPTTTAPFNTGMKQ